MPDFRLHVFRRVAEAGSLTKASQRLHLSQPAITKHIRLLEDEFKQALFVRSSTGVRMTEAGRVLLKHAQQTEQLYSGVRQKIMARQAMLSGRVRIGCSTTITQYYLPKPLLALKQKHPAVEIEVVEGNSEFVVSALLAHRVELGLIESPSRRRDLRVQRFYDDEIIVIAGATRPAGPLTPGALAKMPLIFREIGSGTRLCVETSLQKLGLRVPDLNVVQELPSTEAIKRVVAGGLGFGFVSKLSVESEMELGTLTEVRVKGLRMQRPFSSIFPLGPDPIGLRHLILQFLS